MRKRVAVLALLAASAVLAPALQAGNVPRPSGDFTINLTNGHQVHLSQFKGKVVAFMFILTYCPHCQKITTFLIQDQNQYAPRGFQVLESAIEDGAAAAVPGFLNKFRPPFPVGWNPREPVSDFLQFPMAARMLMPQLIFIDRQGVVQAQYAGDSPFLDETKADANIRGEIESLLKAGAPVKHAALHKK